MRRRKAGAVLAVLAVLQAAPWLAPDKPDSPISVLVIHRRLPDLGKGCDARLVTLLSDLVDAGADVSYLALNASKLVLSDEPAR